MKLKREINGFLKILGLDKVVVDLEALNKELVPFDAEYWIKMGTLTKNEKRLFAVANWCVKNREQLINTSGIVEHCIDEKTKRLLEYICDRKDDNCIKLRLLEVMCTNYLDYLLHERLNFSANIPLLVFADYAVCYYFPGTFRPEPQKLLIPDFVSN